MRKLMVLAATLPALVAAPAAAQLGVGLGGNAGAGVNVGVGVGGNAGGDLVGGVTGTLDRAVGSADGAVNGALQSELRVATAADLTAGATVSDNSGRRVGVLQSVHGDTAVVVSGGKTLHVPIAALYSSGKGLVTKLSRKQLNAAAGAHANAGARANVNN
ncbi:MAG TPA: hypothetical protein VFO51_03240 [Sphingomicrobium sp.]|nr:hypothetical protein [Sphingomicrobium sp.]